MEAVRIARRGLGRPRTRPSGPHWATRRTRTPCRPVLPVQARIKAVIPVKEDQKKHRRDRAARAPTARLRRPALHGAQHRRALLRQAEAVPRRRDPLRQARVHVLGHRRPRVDPDLATGSRPMIHGTCPSTSSRLARTGPATSSGRPADSHPRRHDGVAVTIGAREHARARSASPCASSGAGPSSAMSAALHRTAPAGSGLLSGTPSADLRPSATSPLKHDLKRNTTHVVISELKTGLLADIIENWLGASDTAPSHQRISRTERPHLEPEPP